MPGSAATVARILCSGGLGPAAYRMPMSATGSALPHCLDCLQTRSAAAVPRVIVTRHASTTPQASRSDVLHVSASLAFIACCTAGTAARQAQARCQSTQQNVSPAQILHRKSCRSLLVECFTKRKSKCRSISACVICCQCKASDASDWYYIMDLHALASRSARQCCENAEGAHAQLLQQLLQLLHRLWLLLFQHRVLLEEQAVESRTKCLRSR